MRRGVFVVGMLSHVLKTIMAPCPPENSFAVRLAESFILNRELLTAAIVESCPVPMFVADTAGHWVFVNDVYTRLLCCDAAQLLDDNWVNTLAPSSAATLRSVWDAVVSQKMSIDHLRVEHRQGRGGTVHGYLSVKRVHASSFVGWFVPICCTPQDCPMHGFLLHNIPYPLTLGTLTGTVAAAAARSPISSA